MRVVRTLRKYSAVVSGYGATLILLALCINIPLVDDWRLQFFDTLRTKDIAHDAVIIGIDDTTLQKIGPWPIQRDRYAELISTLADHKPKAVIFDILFLEHNKGDTEVIHALETSPFPIAFASKKDGLFMRESVYASSSQSAYVNVTPDSDGKVRSMRSSVTTFGTMYQPLSLALYDEPIVLGKSSFVYPKSIPEISFIDVISKRVPQELLEDKVIFVGATTLDLGDYFVGMQGAKIPGVHIHLAEYVSYTYNHITKPINKAWSLLAYLLFLLIGIAIVYYSKKIMAHAGVLVTVSLLSIAVSVIAFDSFLLELPIVEILIFFYGGYGTALILTFLKTKKENSLITATFSKYVNKEVLHLLLSHSGFRNQSEKRIITILFSDLRGFTDFSETLSPEELTGLLNRYFEEMVQAIFKQNGTVDKFIGDAVMAFWNAPTTLHNHEYKALCAAIGMQDALTVFNKKEGTHLIMGIGIHSGEAIVGSVGGEERLSYTALGNTVNTASRVESVTKKYGAKILITSEVYEACKNTPLPRMWRIRRLDTVRLKGKKEATLLYEVTQASDEVISAYEKALSLYQEGKWDDAKEILISNVLKEDMPSRGLVERMESMKKTKEFDGVYTFTEK